MTIPTPAAASIAQLNISYNPEEDRLLLKASTSSAEEYRIWLTRRYSGLLMGVLTQQIERAGGTQKLASSMLTTEQFRQGAFDHPFADTQADSFPLGEAGTLGYRINFGKDTENTMQLQLLPLNGQGLTLSLSETMLYLLYNLLENGISQTDWKLALPDNSPAPVH